MKVLVTGATGFVGTRLLRALHERGHRIHILTTGLHKSVPMVHAFNAKAFAWNPSKGEIDQEALEGIEAVIHLAGEGVADGRWSAQKKERILQSRVQGTKLLMEAIKKLPHPPQKFISASAIGIYGNRGEESLDENSSTGEGFLAEVCKSWEQEAQAENSNLMRVYSVRIGVVLGKEGGALKKMLLPFQLGVGGTLGLGRQYMSWIHLDDLVGQFLFLMETDQPAGVYNGVAPRPVSNLVFTKVLGQVLGRPTIFPVPTPIIKLLFGEMSQILLNSQKVLPQKFMDTGYNFQFRALKEALRDILHKKEETKQFSETQLLSSNSLNGR